MSQNNLQIDENVQERPASPESLGAEEDQEQFGMLPEEIVDLAMIAEHQASLGKEVAQGRVKKHHVRVYKNFSRGFLTRLKSFDCNNIQVVFGNRGVATTCKVDLSSLNYADSMAFQSHCNELFATDKSVQSLHYENNMVVFTAGLHGKLTVI